MTDEPEPIAAPEFDAKAKAFVQETWETRRGDRDGDSADLSADDRISPDAPVLHSQWVYAIRHEMAGTADDLLLRRTEFGARGTIEPAIRERAEHLLADIRQEVPR